MFRGGICPLVAGLSLAGAVTIGLAQGSCILTQMYGLANGGSAFGTRRGTIDAVWKGRSDDLVLPRFLGLKDPEGATIHAPSPNRNVPGTFRIPAAMTSR